MALSAQIQTHDIEILSDFENIEAHIRDQNLPDAILERHFETVAHYSKQRDTLLDHLDTIGNANNNRQLRRGTDETLQHLESLTPSQHVPLDPEHLPFRFPTGEARAPLETKADFQKRFPSDINAKTTVRRDSGKTNPKPNDNDLAATEDVQITPQIKALAQELEHQPLKIYKWVYNNIAFISSYGAVKGSALTLETKSGNAFDTASLLIALLRASGIHARYVYGTVEISAPKVINWLKVSDVDAAMELLSQIGIPHRGVRSGGTVKYIRMEHIWVDAWVDYRPSRGARHRKGDSWVPMDASFKQHTFHKGVKLEEAVPFDQQRLLAAIPAFEENQDWITGIDEQQIETLFDEYDAKLQTYVDNNQPDLSLADTIDSYAIIPINWPTLAAGLPYRRIVKGALFATLPDSLRYSLTIKFYNSVSAQRLDNPSLNHTISLPSVSNQRLGITYIPATTNDATALANYRASDSETLPAYLFNLKPVIKLEDTILATGTLMGMGQQQYLTIIINDPVYGMMPQKSIVTVGNEIVIGVNGNGIPSQLVEKRFAQVDSNTAAENLHQTALNFWMMHDLYDDLTAQIHKVRRVRLPSVGLFVSPLSVRYFFGRQRDL